MNREPGFTLLELLITITIIMVLASVAMPLSKMVGKRTREIELRQQLRMVRAAIDLFKFEWNREGELMIGAVCVKNKLTCKEVTSVSGYPKTFDNLLMVELSGEQATIEGKSIRRYVRKIPVDPITGKADWKLRCYSDPPDTTGWCGDDVYDLASASQDTALDGTKYKDW